MSRAVIITVAAVLVPIGAALALANSGWLSGNSASAALLASDIGPARPNVGTDASEAELGVAGGPLDCPPAGAGPEDSEQLFQRQGDNFWVTGTLSSFDGVTAVVAGPNGDVSAKLAPNFNLAGDLSPGSAVEMAGTVAGDGNMTANEIRAVCAGAGVIDCATGEDPRFQLRIEGNSFEVTGRLDSLTNELVRVQGPGLMVEISRDTGTQVEGGLDPGDPIRVEGTVRDAQQLQALRVALRCQEAQTPAATAAPAAQQTSQPQTTEGCTQGTNGRGAMRLRVRDGEAEAKRVSVVSHDGDNLTVESPSGRLSIRVDDETDVEGDLTAAAEVRIRGHVQDDDSILAEEIDVLCVQGNNGNGGEDKDKEKDKHSRDEGGEGDKEEGED
jgi:hypothetical protein